MKLLVNPKDDLHLSLNKNRTEEVVHIIESMPTKFGWIVSSIVVFLVIMTLFSGWVIQYPDVLQGTITINNRRAPVKLVSLTSGSLQICIDTGKFVKKGDYIGYIKNTANIKDVQKIDSLLDKIDVHHVNYEDHRSFFPEDISIGELNESYFNLLNSLYQYLDYYKEGSYEKQREILRKQLLSQKSLLTNDKETYAAEYEKYKLEVLSYTRDSILYLKRIISTQEFEKAKQNLLSKKQQYQSLRKGLTNGDFSIKDIESKLERINIDKTDKHHDLEISLFHNYYRLREAIRSWENKYVFIAPLNGKIAFLNFWKNDDFVENGKEVFSIIPSEKSIIGQVQLPELGAGKVVVGQNVIIKLDNYPYRQFGSIRGRVINISAITNEQISGNTKQSNYLVTVSLPNGLKTNYGTTLTFRNQAKGIAEIVTDKRRLIERLFDDLKHNTK